MKTVVFELRNALCSRRFLLTVAGMTLLSLGSLLNEMKTVTSASVYYLYMVYFYYPIWLIALMFAPVPGTISFCIDWNTGIYRTKIIRCGKTRYIMSKIIIAWATAFLTVLFSQILMLVLLANGRPIFSNEDGNALQNGIYQIYLNKSGIWIYFMSKIFCQSMGAAFFALLALWVSAKVTNPLVAATVPIIGYYIIDNVSVWLKLPIYLSIPRLIKGNIEIVKGIGWTCLYVGGIFGGLALLFGYLFFRNCRRRIENG